MSLDGTLTAMQTSHKVDREILGARDICKEFLPYDGGQMWMAVSEVVKVTSKGQFTLPVEIRRDLALGKDSYVYVTRLGRLIVMKKVEELSLDDISAILQSLAKRSGITRRLLTKEVERARKRLHEEKSGRIQAHGSR